MFITCAQCEKADATLWCKVENLHFCEPCSRALHSKKARKHHHVEPFVAVPICDECEVARAEVEYMKCGGTDMIALGFCKECSLALHSRVARSRHHVKAVSSKRKRDSEAKELESPVAGPFVIDLRPFIIDLSESNSDEENRAPFASVPIKQERLSPPRKASKTADPGNPVNILPYEDSGKAKHNSEAPASTAAANVGLTSH